MKIADALQGVAQLFLDTSPIVYFVERNPLYTALVDDIFDRIDGGTLSAVTSPVTLSECLVIPFRLKQPKAQQDFIDLVVRGKGVSFLPIDEHVAIRAAELRALHNLPLPDSFQVAAALTAGCNALLTNDLTLQRVKEIPILVLDQLEL